MTEFNLELAKQLTEQANHDNEFCVDFDLLWQWCGYNQKSDAKEVLKRNFEIDLDYVQRTGEDIASTHEKLSPQEKAVLKRTIKIYTTIDCALAFVQICQTSNNKSINFFQELLEKENIYVHVVKPSRKEYDFGKLLKSVVSWKYDVIEQKQVKVGESYLRIDFFIPDLNLAIEYDEKHHKSENNRELDELREKLIIEKIHCQFIRISENREYEGIEKVCKAVFG
jgi:transposase